MIVPELVFLSVNGSPNCKRSPLDTWATIYRVVSRNFRIGIVFTDTILGSVVAEHILVRRSRPRARRLLR